MMQLKAKKLVVASCLLQAIKLALPASLKLSIGDSHLDNIGGFHIVGEVTNQGSTKATFVKVSGAFL
jgi:hypothetical protein